MPAADAFGSIINYRPGGCITVGMAKPSEEDCTIALRDTGLMQWYDKGHVTNALPNRKEATS